MVGRIYQGFETKKLQNFGNGTYWEAASSETGNIFEANIKMDLGQGVTVGGE